MGDKTGKIGICEGDRIADDDDEDDTAAYTVQGHSKASISCIRMAPKDSHTLYTAAYDCTLRALNFETGKSTEVFDANLLTKDDFDENDALLSGFDFAPDGNELYSKGNWL